MTDKSMDHMANNTGQFEDEYGENDNGNIYSDSPSFRDLISKAQERTPSSVSPSDDSEFITVDRCKRKRFCSESVNDNDDTETGSVYTANEDWFGEAYKGPKIVIISCPDANLAKISPMKVAKAINDIACDMVNKVNKVRNGLAVHCFTSGQAARLKKITTLGQWAVNVEFPKSETQCKGVISGISDDITENEILEFCGPVGVIAVRRLKRKYMGKLEDSLSVCLTFNKKYLPGEVCIGYEVYQVKPYVEKVLRCFKCQRLGHMASSCNGKIRCVRCGGPHKFDECSENNERKCCRCGGKHSAAYEGCESIKEAKKINSVKANKCMSYVEAAKIVKEATYVAPAERDRQNIQGNSARTNHDKVIDCTFVRPITQVKKVPAQNNVKPIIQVADVATQTKVDHACQTDEKMVENSIPIGPQLVYLIGGILQIYEGTKNKKEREQAIESLIQKHIRAERQCKQKKGRDKDSSKNEKRLSHARSSSSTKYDSESDMSGDANDSCGSGHRSRSSAHVSPPSFSYKSCEFRSGEGYKPKNGKT